MESPVTPRTLSFVPLPSVSQDHLMVPLYAPKGETQ